MKALLVSIAATAALTLSPPFAGGEVPPIKRDCGICHQVDIKDLPLKAPLSGLCLGCHPERVAPAEHAVDIAPSMPVHGLPLKDGLISCVTCHDPHGGTGEAGMLRASPEELCLYCHEK